ncbi:MULTISPECIES: hypothetical protein [Bifidobacterium]|uniref:hypothetical protein n=1 Tax=Bifidobacterium TaxID=1678 RepID=UPI0018DEB34C|nr:MULTISPECIES: hypothetical protein [Bifidobacterium]MBI0145133.1 hypothetical protein [Bifidobacterium polysaccharolyticum]MBI0151956.1 hypothetical protein [Bifidobacterium sp. M0399]
MPGWIWIFLVIFMLAMLIGGAVYAIRHAMTAGRSIGRVSDDLNRHMPQPPVAGQSQATDRAEGPAFALPLSHSTERYSQAHAQVLQRREQRRRNHARVWRRWKQFNK